MNKNESRSRVGGEALLDRLSQIGGGCPDLTNEERQTISEAIEALEFRCGRDAIEAAQRLLDRPLGYPRAAEDAQKLARAALVKQASPAVPPEQEAAEKAALCRALDASQQIDWSILGRFFKVWIGSSLHDSSGAEVDLEEPYEAFRRLVAGLRKQASDPTPAPEARMRIKPSDGEPYVTDDEEVSLDWRSPDGSLLTLAVSPAGHAAFAWHLESGQQGSGTVELGFGAHSVLYAGRISSSGGIRPYSGPSLAAWLRRARLLRRHARGLRPADEPAAGSDAC